MNLSTIIEKKKEEFKQKYYLGGEYMTDLVADEFEKAIRESVEEALREVRPKFSYEYDGRFCFFESDFDSRIKEFMK